MPMKFSVLGGRGVFWVWGGECRFYFYGPGDFSEHNLEVFEPHSAQ